MARLVTSVNLMRLCLAAGGGCVKFCVPLQWLSAVAARRRHPWTEGQLLGWGSVDVRPAHLGSVTYRSTAVEAG